MNELYKHLARALQAAREELAESEHETKVYRDALFDTQRALDMRCLDRPSQVGCDDTIFEVPAAAKSWKERAERAEAQVETLFTRLGDLDRDAMARIRKAEAERDQARRERDEALQRLSFSAGNIGITHAEQLDAVQREVLVLREALQNLVDNRYNSLYPARQTLTNTQPAATAYAEKLVREAKDACEELTGKLKFALQFIYCEDGTFTFPDGDTWDAGSLAHEYIPLQVREAVEREREACAQIAESHLGGDWERSEVTQRRQQTCSNIAATIRARTTTRVPEVK